MERLFCLIIASVMCILFVLMHKKGKKYSMLIDNAEEKEFLLKDLYTVGFGWQETISSLSYESPLAQKMKRELVVIYDKKYCEFYCRLFLAQAYTFAHLIIFFSAILAGNLDGIISILLLLVGIVIGVAVAANSIKIPAEKVKNNANKYIIEFPNMVSKLALMINSGMILREAWFYIAETSIGSIGSLVKKTCQLMQNGKSDIEAISYFGEKSGSKELKKFSASLIQGMSKGNAELADVLLKQSEELWERKRQLLLQEGELAATKLVIPTALMFAGVILIIVGTCISGLSM